MVSPEETTSCHINMAAVAVLPREKGITVSKRYGVIESGVQQSSDLYLILFLLSFSLLLYRTYVGDGGGPKVCNREK